MSNKNPINDNKRDLLAYKEKILEEMQYYDKRIEEFRSDHRNKCYYDESDSSEAEDYFPNIAEMGPEVPQLKAKQALLKTCLQATQELTNLTVLQSEINVLVEDPQFDGEKPVTEPGVWQEVTAECRIDLVPFTIVFYMHAPNRKFGPTSYRGLQLSLVKKSHEVELCNSVLHTLKRPSDAVEVVRSYAVGYRSRRITLARLANKYASSLFMEPHPEGGFVLKCANLLEILWRLENKWSPVAPFHHRMKFDLEYMDESYIKTITQAHKQLLDPAIQTDERTLLLSKIINTCLEARGPVDSESDLESKQTDAQTELDLKDRDSEVMAPPKSLPKKTKKLIVKDKKVNEITPKDKTTPQKRSMEDHNEGSEAKKVKTTENDSTVKKIVKSVAKNTDSNNEQVKKNSNEKLLANKNVKNSDKSKQINKKNNQKDQTEVVPKVNIVSGNENNKNTANIAKKRKNNEITKNNEKDSKELKKTKSNEELKRNNVQTGETEPKKIKSSTDINKGDEQIFDIKRKKNEVAKNNKEDSKELKKTKSNEELKRNNVQTGETEPKKIKSSVDINKGDEQIFDTKRKTNEVTKNNRKDSKELKKTKSNEELKRNNVQTGETEPKKIKSSTDINKGDEQIFDTKADNETNKLKNKTRDEKKTKEKKSNVVENKESENTKVSKTAEKHKNNEERTKKVNRKVKMSIANDKKFDQITKKISGNIETKNLNSVTKNTENNATKTVIKSKNIKVNGKSEADQGNSNNIEKKIVDVPKPAESQYNNVKQTKLTETVNNKNSGNTKDFKTVKTFTEKNANTIKSKEKIINVKKVVTEKINKEKPTTIFNKPEKVVISTSTPKNYKKLPKITTKSVRNIIHKSPKLKPSIKIQESRKSIKTKISDGNTQVFSGNSEKENGSKISKIPQKKMSFNSEKILKSNVLRISPRRLPSKFKTQTQDRNIKQLTKSTNIPRFIKATAPEVSK